MSARVEGGKILKNEKWINFQRAKKNLNERTASEWGESQEEEEPKNLFANADY